MLEIRKATIEDCKQVTRLVNDLILELGGSKLELKKADQVCERLVGDAGLGAALVAIDEKGSIVGVCCMSYQTAIRTGGAYAIVQEMFVAPEQRGSGVGGKLLREAATVSADAGCGVLELGIPDDGERQEHFYRSDGFSTVGLRMRKVLSTRG